MIGELHSCHAAFINMQGRSRSCSSCSSCPSAVAWPTLLLQLLRQWKRWRQQMQRWFKATRLWLRMARTKSLQSLLGMTEVLEMIKPFKLTQPIQPSQPSKLKARWCLLARMSWPDLCGRRSRKGSWLQWAVRLSTIGASWMHRGGGTLMHRGHCVHFSGPLSIGNLQCICVYHHPFVHEISGGVCLEISFIVKFYSPPLEAI